MSTRRQQQVSEFLREEISDIMLRELNDPRLGFVSLTRVEVSPDLRVARVFVSVLGSDEEFQNAVKALNGASGFIRHLLKPRMRVRHIPELTFLADHSMRHAEEIARTLRAIREEDEDRGDSDSSEDVTERE